MDLMDATDLLMEAATTLADVVAATFGLDCEVAVHDLRRPRESLVHLANGHVTGREYGSPIRDLIFRVLPNLRDGESAVLNYLTVLQDGRRLKSTTALLRDADGQPAIAFCVNLDVSALEAGVAGLARITTTSEATLQRPLETVDVIDPAPVTDRAEVTAVLETLVSNVVREFAKPPDAMTKADRIQLVSFLHEKGAFLVRGAVALIADRLAVSEPTVYRYLDEIRAQSTGSVTR